MEGLSEIFAYSLISELTNTRKATHNHFSVVGGKYSKVNCTDEVKKDELDVLANNNILESLFGDLMHNIEWFGIISLANVGRMILARQTRVFDTELLFTSNKSNGVYNTLYI